VKRLFLVFITLFIVFGNAVAQQADACNGKKVAASVSCDVMAALMRAIRVHDFEEVVRIAGQPESGLKVVSLCRNKEDGRITSYLIVNLAGCTFSTLNSAR